MAMKVSRYVLGVGIVALVAVLGLAQAVRGGEESPAAPEVTAPAAEPGPAPEPVNADALTGGYDAPAPSDSEADDEAPEPRADPPSAVTAPACADGDFRPLRTARSAYAAVARGTMSAHRAPGGAALARFERLNVNGVPTVFGVLGAILDADCEPRWYRVQLPLKPNGVVGYVRPGDVDLEPISTRVTVSLSARTVTLFDGGRQVLQARAAIGSSATPTPVGDFYVNQRLRTTNTGGPFGPGGIGISAFSDVLTGWAQGGPIALHGTNRPDLLGQAVSNGCIRLRNDVVEELFRLVLPGTPVIVRA
jgi:hypothetical protein